MEALSRDELSKLLGEGATEEQKTNILNLLHNQTNDLNKTISNLQSQVDKYKDYDDIKSQLNAYNQSKMTEQEKLEAQRKEIETNLKQSRIIKNKAQVMTILAGRSIDEDIINSLVSEDENSSIEKAKKMASQIDTIIANAKLEKEQELEKVNVKPDLPNNNNETQTDNEQAEKFNKMSYNERIELKNSNPELFNKLNSQNE